jgi:hypothetical protein
LDEGIYSATIDSFGVEINGQHYADLVIAYTKDGKAATAKFLNKGIYSDLQHARSAYEGLSIIFDHAGGEIGAYFNMLPTADVSGAISVRIRKERSLDTDKPVEQVSIVSASNESSCLMDASHLAWYERGWVGGQCCGMIMELYGQDYIIIKRSIGDNNIQIPCLNKFRDRGYPAIAWPTLDKQNFVLSTAHQILFKFNQTICDLVNKKIANGDYINLRGNITDIDQLITSFDMILFPII